MKKKTRKKVARRKRRSMREKRVMRIKRGLMKGAKKLRLGAKRTGAYVYGTLRRIVGNGVRTHNKEGQKLYVVLVRGVPLKYQPPFRPGIVYYTKGWAIKKARAFGGEVVSVSDFMKYQRDTRKRAIQLGYMPKEYLSESERKLVGNPGVRERVMQIIRQDGEDKTDGEVLDEIYDYLKSIRSSDPVVRQLMKLSGQYRSPGDEGEILDDVASTLRMLRENPRLGKEEKKALDFAKKYPGWHGFNPRKHTADAVRRLAKKGLVELSDISNQFRAIRKNPPMYAHGMTAHRTHGLSLKQMMKLYRLVSSGNPKAVMYARRTLGIPMSESLSQVKAVVYHHVMDLRRKM